MPRLKLSDHSLNYRTDGDAGNKPWLLFCNSLGADLHMWDKHVDALSGDFHILRYDRRGHGLSTAPPPPFTIADLGNDVIALLDVLDIETTHFCGVSIGGLTGQWLALHAGQRLGKVVVCATAAKIGTAESWNGRIDAVRKDGLQPLAAATAERWFSPEFRADEPAVVKDVLKSFAATSIDGYTGCCAALAEADFRGELSRIEVPLLAISGADDPVCPPADLEAIATAVGNGQHISLPGRHFVSMESTETFIEVVRSSLSRHNQ